MAARANSSRTGLATLVRRAIHPATHPVHADVAVASYIKYGQLFFRMDIGAFPNVVRYMEQVEQREAFQSTVMGG